MQLQKECKRSHLGGRSFKQNLAKHFYMRNEFLKCSLRHLLTPKNKASLFAAFKTNRGPPGLFQGGSAEVFRVTFKKRKRSSANFEIKNF